jgi:hypothetical protein
MHRLDSFLGTMRWKYWDRAMLGYPWIPEVPDE